MVVETYIRVVQLAHLWKSVILSMKFNIWVNIKGGATVLPFIWPFLLFYRFTGKNIFTALPFYRFAKNKPAATLVQV